MKIKKHNTQRVHNRSSTISTPIDEHRPSAMGAGSEYEEKEILATMTAQHHQSRQVVPYSNLSKVIA